MLRHDDRLNEEEAAAVARLHAERIAPREATELDERERLASTTAPEELASLIGATPEEIRELAEEVRRTSREAQSRRFEGHPLGLGLAILFFVIVAVVILAAVVPTNR